MADPKMSYEDCNRCEGEGTIEGAECIACDGEGQFLVVEE